jgi:glycosyltransferase involved in cell wall biosynthesis
MRVSVAMATRNAERFLAPLIESLARQTRPPDELVVYDDASEDATVELLEELARPTCFPLRMIRGPARRGPTEGFLRAAAACQGELVAFCDQDDVWLEHKLDVCHEAIEGSGAQLALHRVRVVDADLHEIAPPWPRIDRDRIVPPLGMTGLAVDAPGMAMVFRRSLLHAADSVSRPPSRYDPERQMLHDEWMLFLAGVVGAVRLIREPLLLYRQHGANESGWFERERDRSLTPATEDYRRAAAHCAACAEYLGAASAPDPEVAAALTAGAEHYRAAADAWRLRIALYAERRRAPRVRIVRRLASARAYRPTPAGGFGAPALAKDALAGVLLRRGSGSE